MDHPGAIKLLKACLFVKCKPTMFCTSHFFSKPDQYLLESLYQWKLPLPQGSLNSCVQEQDTELLGKAPAECFLQN